MIPANDGAVTVRGRYRGWYQPRLLELNRRSAMEYGLLHTALCRPGWYEFAVDLLLICNFVRHLGVSWFCLQFSCDLHFEITGRNVKMNHYRTGSGLPPLFNKGHHLNDR